MPASIDPPLVRIEEESPDSTTGGRYGVETVSLTAPAGVESHIDVVIPVPISLLTASMDVGGKTAGDCMGFDVAPEAAVGALGSAVAAAAKVIDLPQPVIDLFANGTLFVGQHLILDDGTNKDDCGVVTSIDTQALQVTTKAGTTNAFNAGTTTIRITTSMSPAILGDGWVRLEPGQSKVYIFGESKIGGSFIKAGTVLRIRYKNTGTADVEVSAILEYLY